jgi:uncharacterized protein YqjF (DUF2071 family)
MLSVIGTRSGESLTGRPVMRFLTARWSNLFLATYAVPEELLWPRLPPGLDLDRRVSQCFASLVAFDFLDTKVLGVPWPGFRHFPELNLRFYVRHGDRRGVVFVREYVPQRLVAWLARSLYNEPYCAARMTSRVEESSDRLTLEHRIEFGGRTHLIAAIGDNPRTRPTPDSVEHFFKEHEWGFGTTRGGRTLCYRVEHPVWEVYRVAEWKVDIDWGTLYGPEWAVMQGATPYSTVLAAGSTVAVYTGKPLP